MNTIKRKKNMVKKKKIDHCVTKAVLPPCKPAKHKTEEEKLFKRLVKHVEAFKQKNKLLGQSRISADMGVECGSTKLPTLVINIKLEMQNFKYE